MIRNLASTLTLVLVGAASAQPPDLPPPVPGQYPSGVVPLPDAELIKQLILKMDDPEPEVRQNLAMAAAELGPVAVEPLTAALKDEHLGRRASAAYALGRIGQPAASSVPGLLEALKDESLDVRRQASYALSRILAAVNGRGPTAPAIGVRP